MSVQIIIILSLLLSQSVIRRRQSRRSSYLVFQSPRVTRLGNFWKFLVRIFLTKVSNFLGYLEKNSLFCKNVCGYFLGNFWKHFLLQHLVTLDSHQPVANIVVIFFSSTHTHTHTHAQVSFQILFIWILNCLFTWGYNSKWFTIIFPNWAFFA